MTRHPSERITLYIAGPMTGIEEINYPAFFEAEDRLQAAGYATLNPARSNERQDAPRPRVANEGGEWTDYMRNGLNQLVRADGVALLPGWEKSRGAGIEVNLAVRLGMTFGDVALWLRAAEERAA